MPGLIDLHKNDGPKNIGMSMPVDAFTIFWIHILDSNRIRIAFDHVFAFGLGMLILLFGCRSTLTIFKDPEKFLEK